MASAIGAQLSVVSGGLLCLLGVVGVVRAFPELPAHVLAPGAVAEPAPGAVTG